MILDYRSNFLLTKLINENEYITVEELVDKLSLSRRMINYDLKKVNMWLEYNGFSPIQHIHSLGFFIRDEEKLEIQKNFNESSVIKYEYSVDERKALIIIYLMAFDGKVFLNDLINKIGVSRNTVLSDLKELKRELEKFSVEIVADRKQGYILVGNERKIRSVLVFYLSRLINVHDVKGFEYHLQDLKFVWDYNMDEISKIICECEKVLQVEYTYEFYSKFSLLLIFFMNRISNNKMIEISSAEKEVLTQTNEYRAAKYVANKFEQLYNIHFLEDEIVYITIHFLCAKINNLNNSDILNENEACIKNITGSMIDDFQRFACVNFQERKKLEKNLLVHVKSAYYRIRYGIEIDAPLTDQVMEKYSSLFFLTKKAMHHLEKHLNQKVNDDEIAYIAMHFGGWMNEEGLISPVRKKAILVCSSGIGTSQLLKIQLDELLSTVDIIKVITLREYENEIFAVDFIISTVPLVKKKEYKNIFVVSPIMSALEKEMLLSRVNASIGINDNHTKYVETLLEIIEQHTSIKNRERLQSDIENYIFKAHVEIKEDTKPMLKELLKSDYIKFVDSAENWEEAIKIASEPLLENEHIERKYIDAMIDSIKTIGPYICIAPRIAIPHSRPENGVNKIGMSFLRIKNGVSFSEKEEHQVYLLIVLAAIDNETHLKALAQLSNVLSEENNIEDLILSDDADTVVKIIEKYSN